MRIDRSGEADEPGRATALRRQPDRPPDGDGDRDGGMAGDAVSDAATYRGVSGDDPEWQQVPRPEQSVRVERALAHRATVDAVYRRHAIDPGCARVQKLERETVTPAMRRIEAQDPDRTLIGLEHRLKGKDRLAEKVEFDMGKWDVTAEKAFTNVKNAIRYTFQYPEDKYAAGVLADIDRLKSEGFKLTECRNSWDDGAEYKRRAVVARVAGERGHVVGGCRRAQARAW